jgi:hypothetical protein
MVIFPLFFNNPYDNELWHAVRFFFLITFILYPEFQVNVAFTVPMNIRAPLLADKLMILSSQWFPDFSLVP